MGICALLQLYTFYEELIRSDVADQGVVGLYILYTVLLKGILHSATNGGNDVDKNLLIADLKMTLDIDYK